MLHSARVILRNIKINALILAAYTQEQIYVSVWIYDTSESDFFVRVAG